MLPDHIQLTANPDQALRNFLNSRKYNQVLVLTDENTLSYCFPKIEKQIPAYSLIQIKSGEENKTLSTCAEIWEAMTEHKLDRHSVLVVLGGGVLGDMGGFCAATYKRGIDFVLIPTTLLAQADASIGGKLGIDFKHFKNQLGVFLEPSLTILSDVFLATLPENELRSGFAEVIKHALISDMGLWNEIKSKGLHDQNWPALLKHSATFKYSIIRQDPTEKGLRKILNAGHTIGHALESYFLSTKNPISHGEAVAAGLIIESYIAQLKGMLSKEDVYQIADFLLGIFPRLTILDEAIPEITALSRQDKKNKDNKILAALLDGVGRAKWDCEITEPEIERALAFYRSLQT
jgi:3-dehydroquinate synthase